MQIQTVGCFLLTALVALGMARGNCQTNVTEEQGLKPYDALTGSDIDSVSMTNGSLTLQIPLASFPQRGGRLGLSFFVRFSSNSWTVTKTCEPATDPGVPPQCTSYWMPSPSTPTSSFSSWGPEVVSSMDWRLTSGGKGGVLSVQSSDGNAHLLGSTYSMDGTMLLYTPNSGTGGPFPATVTDANGNVYLFNGPSLPSQTSSLTDANGNQITLNSSGWSDTLGRSIPGSPEFCPWGSTNGVSNCSGSMPIQPGVPTSYMSGCPSGTTAAMLWNAPGLNSGTRQFEFCYGNITLQTNFQSGQIVEYSGTALMLNAVILPDLTSWIFSYDGYGNVTQLTLPTGGTISYQYANGGQVGCPTLSPSHINRRVASRTLNANDGTGGHTTNYSFSGGSNSVNNIVTYTNTVTSPDNNDTVYTVQNPVPGAFCFLYPTKVQAYQGSAQTGTLLKTTTTAYVTPNSSSSTGGSNLAPSQITVTLPNGQSNQTVITYDTTSFSTVYGGATGGTTIPLVNAVGALQSDEYDSHGTLYRTTQNHYVWQQTGTWGPIYKSANLLTIRDSSTTLDQTKSPPVQTAQTLYYYDQWPLSSSGVSTGLVAEGPIRGNLTGIARWVSTGGSISTLNYYYDSGMLASTKDTLGNITSFAYSTNYAGAYLTQTNAPDTQMPDVGAPVVHHVTNATYDYNTGLMASFTDENSNQSSYQYDPATLRLKQSNHPDGGSTKFFYPNPTTVERQRLISGTTHDDSFVYIDGLGRTTQTQLNAPGCTVLADTTYDANGRVASVSNPYCSGAAHSSDPTYGLTQTQYDALGRVLQITRPDNSVAKVQYDSNCTTTTDESGRQKKGCTDAFGRLIEVDEPATYSPPIAASGSDSISGTEQSAQVLTTPATPGTGTVQINGAVQWKTVSSATTGGTTSITINGTEQQSSPGVIPGTATIAITGTERSIAGAQATGSVTINYSSFNDRSTTVTSQAANSASGSVTIGGTQPFNTKSTTTTSPTGTGTKTVTAPVADSGTISITVNTGSSTLTWSTQYNASANTTSGLASNLQSSFTTAYGSNNPQLSVAVSSSNSSALDLTAPPGAAGNSYTVTTSVTSSCVNSTSMSCGTAGGWTAGAANPSGGANAVTQTVYDTGSVSITVNTQTYKVPFGQPDTANTIASNLVTAINQDTTALVTASATGNVVNLTAKAIGAAGNGISYSSSYTYDTKDFSAANFTTSPPSSTTSGGKNAIYDNGTVTLTGNGHATVGSPWGQGTTPQSIASDLAAKINADSNASVTATASSGSNGLYRIQLSGGSYWYKYYADFGMSQPGVTYTVQLAVHNNAQSIVQVSSNISSATIPPGATENVVLTFNGNGVSDVQLIFGTVNTTADPVDVTVWNPYVANVANGTNLASSIATFSGAGWYAEPGVNVTVTSDTRYAFLNLTASKTKGSTSNYPFTVATTFDSTDFSSASFITLTNNGLGQQMVTLSPSMLSSNGGFGSEYYSGQIVDGSEGCCGWGTDTSSAGAYLQIDLGAGNAQAVTEAGIFAGSAGYKGDWYVYYSDDDSNWHNIASGFYPNLQGWNWDAWAYGGAHRYWQLILANTPGSGPWLTELQLMAQTSNTLALSGGWPNVAASDSGTMKVAINSNNYSVNWGSSDTTATIASNLYTALKADPAVTASLSGSTITLTPKSSTYSFSTSYTFDSQDFSKSSFTPASQISDYGTAVVTVKGHSDSINWGGADTPLTIASALANTIKADSSAVVNASVSNGTLSLTSRTTGASTNYTLASAATFDTSNFGGSSFAPSNSGSALTGGADAVFTTVYDNGTVTLTINEPNGAFQVSAPYQQGSTSGSVANAIVNAVNSTNGSPVTATVNGSTLNITAQAGAAGNFTWSATSASGNSGTFPQPSFSESLSGSSLTGGANAVTGSLSTSWQTLYFYDTRNNLLCVEQHGNATGANATGCAANPSNDATSLWRVRRFTYDSLHHLLTSSNPENGTLTYSYDAIGRLSTRTDARGIVTTYQYRDTSNGGLRLTDIIHSDSTPATRLRYDYASYNNVALSNAIGRQNVTLSDNGAKYLTSFDSMGRPSGAQQCTPGVTNCQNFSASYNGLGEPGYIQYPSGFQVNYSYDGAGRLISATDNANFNYASVQPGDFLASGAMKQFETPNFNYNAGYNNRLQPVEISAGPANAPFFDKQYNYNPGANNGDVMSIKNLKDDGRSQAFYYDSINRLVSAGDNKNWSDSYVYDPWGNLTQKNPGAPQGETLQANADVHNHLTAQNSAGGQIYTYDLAGNLLTDGFHTYTYDAENRVKTVDGTATYTYDGAGRRIAKSSGEHTWYGPNGGILAETDASDNWTNYVYWASRRLARNTPQPSPNPPDIKYYVSDHLDSTAMFVDKDGKTILDDNDFFPFGAVIPQVGSTNSTNHFKFTGKERDSESNLDYFGARYYSSTLGRWTSADWSAVPAPVPYANLVDPQTLNLHAYVRNVPTVGTDSDGHSMHSYIPIAPFVSELLNGTEMNNCGSECFGAVVTDPDSSEGEGDSNGGCSAATVCTQPGTDILHPDRILDGDIHTIENIDGTRDSYVGTTTTETIYNSDGSTTVTTTTTIITQHLGKLEGIPMVTMEHPIESTTSTVSVTKQTFYKDSGTGPVIPVSTTTSTVKPDSHLAQQMKAHGNSYHPDGYSYDNRIGARMFAAERARYGHELTDRERRGLDVPKVTLPTDPTKGNGWD